MTWLIAKLGIRGIALVVVSVLLAGATFALKHQIAKTGEFKATLAAERMEHERAMAACESRVQAAQEAFSRAKDQAVATLSRERDSAAENARTARKTTNRALAQCRAEVEELTGERDALRTRENEALPDVACLLDIRAGGVLAEIAHRTERASARAVGGPEPDRPAASGDGPGTGFHEPLPVDVDRWLQDIGRWVDQAGRKFETDRETIEEAKRRLAQCG